MLGKYWSIYLLAGLAVAALADARRALYFLSAAPWITIAVGALLLAPHFAWLVQHDFLPLTYAIGAHGVKTFGQTLVTAGRYLGGDPGDAAVPVLAVLILTRPSAAALADTLLRPTPERRFVVVAFSATLLLPVLVGPLMDIDLNPIWTMAVVILFPVMLLSSTLLTLSRQAVTAITAFAVALPLAMLAAAPAIALAIHLAGSDPVGAHAQMFAARVEEEWRRSSDRPLRIVGGDFGLANAAIFYMPEQPSAYPVLEPETTPWVTPADIVRDGAAMVCELPYDWPDCVFLVNQGIAKAIAGNPPARRVVVKLTRSFLGIAGTPERYLIMIVPPAP